MRKTLIILRGVPGCGKSSLAMVLALMGAPDVEVCSADHFFSGPDGKYNFDKNKLGDAHAECQDKALDAVQAEVPVVVIDNTNINTRDFLCYEEMAKDHGYTVFHLVVENRHGSDSIHPVPAHTINRMRNNLRPIL